VKLFVPSISIVNIYRHETSGPVQIVGDAIEGDSSETKPPVVGLGIDAGSKGIRVAEWLARQKVDVVLSREVLRGRGPAHVLRDAGVALKLIESEEVDLAIRRSMRRPASD
jgi:hypothetical protein